MNTSPVFQYDLPLVEFRWLQIQQKGPWEMKLQYRQKREHPFGGLEWGPWKTVPTVPKYAP